jgi:hypothetical protein
LRWVRPVVGRARIIGTAGIVRAARSVRTARILTILARLLGSLLPELAAALARFRGDVTAATATVVVLGRLPFGLLTFAWRRRICRRGRQLDPARNVPGSDGIFGQQPNRDLEICLGPFLRMSGEKERRRERCARRASNLPFDCRTHTRYLPPVQHV